MRKSTKAIIAAAVAGAGIMTAIGIGSSGFTEGDITKWFNNWGQGAAVVQTVEQPEETPTEQSMSRAAVNLGLTHDSDEGMATLAYSRYSSPQISVSEQTGSVQIYGGGFSGYNFHVSINYSFGTTLYDETLPYSSGKVYTFSYNELVTNYAQSAITQGKDLCLRFSAYNVGDSDYSDSETVTKSVYVPVVKRSVLELGVSDLSLTLPVFTATEFHPGYSETGGGWGFSDPFYDFTLYEYNSNHEIVSTTEYKPTFNKNVVSYDNIPFITASENNLTVSLLDMDISSHVGSTFTLYFDPKIIIATSAGTSAVYNRDNYAYVTVPFRLNYNFAITKLDTPSNIRIENTTLKWDSVDGANGYAVFFGEDSETSETPELDISKYTSGTYTVRVRALGNVGQALAANELSAMSLTAYNASSVITQVVALTYDIDGETVTKFVPHGKNVSEYLYDVDIKNKEFGGWYYDSGFSRRVESTDVLNGDITIYARISDVKVTDRPLSWWDLHWWHLLIGIVAGLVVAGVVAFVVVKKRKNR